MADPETTKRPKDSLALVVSGDVTMDWNLAREPLARGDSGGHDTHASWQRGGAALLADLLGTVAAALGPGRPGVTVRAVEAPGEPVPPGDEERNHSYSIWSRCPRSAQDKGPGTAWRVQSFLGVDRARSDAAVRAEWQRLEADLPNADVVVLDDAALGFRDLSDAGLWRSTFAERRPWVVLKQARPVARGPLWEHLLAEAPDRLVVVLRIDDLRGREVQVSRALSWERTAQDLLRELVFNPTVNALSRVAHTVISFGPAGAMLVSGPSRRRGDPAQRWDVGPAAAQSCTLFFDPERVEGTWEGDHPGWTMGGTDCLTAALVRELILDPDTPRLDRGIQAGVVAARRLHDQGYQEQGLGRLELGFPVTAVVEEIQAEREALQHVNVPDRYASERDWTILEDRCRSADLAKPADLVAKATEIALHGPKKTLGNVPLGRFGHLVTADRSEIEAFRSIGALIDEYVRNPRPKPLSIGVFGPPGSGKSFGVKQVARSVAGREIADEPLEFNLAQLRSPDELADAFHLVRDVSLAGRIPLVFWDEFDTSMEGPLGWLRHFLAPMQDGEFRQGQLTHPIGRAIFVFAGGTAQRLEEFGAQLSDEELRQAKAPDFVSRLKGYINVLGPNARDVGEDPYYVIRRAILVRSILERNAEALFDDGLLRIDSGVLRALLQTGQYRHGARSLEAIVTMSRLSNKDAFERSCLPPEPQLDLHVDAAEFLWLVGQPELDEGLQDQLARAAHEVYCEGMAQRGQTSDSVVSYDELDEYKKEQNRRSVRDIPAKLERVGCVRVPARDADPGGFAFTNAEVEILAREEHDRWMRDLGPGWQHGEHTYKARRIHDAYLPWEQLPEAQKDKDRDLVREIPAILARAGYGIARNRSPAVAIGVTGHRALTDVDRIEAGLDKAVGLLEQAYPGRWTVVSALAEGADRLVARRLLARVATRLVAVLPLDRENYESGFATEASRREFAELVDLADEVVQIPPQPTRDQAYEAGGQAVLARADALVAVWDGNDAQGIGGTGAIAAAARERGVPLAWIHVGNRTPGTLEPTSLDDAQGQVTVERIPQTRRRDGS